MSDNPNGPELLNLGVEVDTASFGALNNQYDQLSARIQELIEKLSALALTGDEGAASLLSSLQKIPADVRNAGESFDVLKSRVQQVAAEYENLGRVAHEANAELGGAQGPDINQMALGYGVKGGMVGPAEAEAGSIGSQFGIGHALSVAGHATGSPALRELGAAVYIEEGLRRIGPLFEQLNTNIIAAADGTSPLIEGLSSLGVPMAGLVSVAGPLAIAAIGLGVALAGFFKIITDGNKAVDDAVKAQVKYYEEISKLTSDEAQAKIEDAKKTQDANVRARDNLKQIITEQLQGHGWTPENISDVFNKPGSEAATDARSIVWLQELFKQFDALGVEADKAGASMVALQNGIQKGDFAANDAAQAALKYADANIQRTQQLAADDNLTSEAAKKKVGMLTSERDAIMASLEALRPYVETNADAKKKFEDLSAQLSGDSVEIEHLTQVSIPLAEAREREKEALKQLQKAIEEAAKETEKALKTLAEAPQKLFEAIAKAQEQFNNQVANARLRESQQEEQYRPGSLEDVHAREEIRSREGRDEQRVMQDTADRIIDIRSRLGEKEADLATDLQRNIFDDETRYYQDRARLALSAQRQAQEDAISHAQKIHDINARAFYDDQEALLDRNFLQLAKNQLQRQRAIDEENSSYAQRQASLQRHLAQQEQDLVISLIQREQHERLSYERKLADAMRAAEREIVQAEVAENRKLAALRRAEQQALADLTHNEQYKIQILRRNLANQEIILRQEADQKIKIAIETERVIVQKAMEMLAKLAVMNPLGFLAGLFGGHPNIPGHASGGSFNAYEPFTMSEPSAGAENMMFGTKGYNVPGAALVYPLQSGSVERTSGGAGKTIHIAPGAFPISISGVSDPERAADLAASKVYDKLQGLYQP